MIRPTILALVSLALASLCGASLPTTSFLAGVGQMNGARYEVWVDELRLSSQWNPEKEELPLSVAKATLLARGALKKMVGAAADAHFECSDLRLRVTSGNWFYVVTFSSDDTLATKKEGLTYPAVLSFVVYFHEGVEVPNQSPQPPQASGPRG